MKCWPRAKKYSTNREYSSRAIDCIFFFCEALRRLVSKRLGGRIDLPPTRTCYGKCPARARVRSLYVHMLILRKIIFGINQTMNLIQSRILLGDWFRPQVTHWWHQKFLLFEKKASYEAWFNFMPELEAKQKSSHITGTLPAPCLFAMLLLSG